MVLAVGAEPRQADRTVTRDEAWVHCVHVLLMVGCIRVVGCMQGQRLAVVVDGHIDGATECLLNTLRCPAATGKVVDEQLTAQVERHGEIVSFHADFR